MSLSKIIDSFQKARRSSHETVVEGLQALKHIVRFSGEIKIIITPNSSKLMKLLDELSPDVSKAINEKIVEVDIDTLSILSPRYKDIDAIAIVKIANYDIQRVDESRPIVFLENPRNLDNIGAAIRVAAAANCGAVIVDSHISVWHPSVMKASAGLNFALPVFNMSLHNTLLSFPNRPLAALDPKGSNIKSTVAPGNSILIFGTERYGVSDDALSKSDHVFKIPMKDGVSSLNLATSVAATLYIMC